MFKYTYLRTFSHNTGNSCVYAGRAKLSRRGARPESGLSPLSTRLTTGIGLRSRDLLVHFVCLRSWLCYHSNERRGTARGV